MKKLFLFALIVFIFFPLSRSVNAQTLTPTPDPCTPDAPLSAPCPVHYDSTNVAIPRTKTWVSSLISSIVQLLGPKNASFDWAGSLSPSGNKYAAAKILPSLGQQLQQSSENDLKPSDLQVVTTPDPQQKPFTMSSVLCITNPENGTITQISSSDRIESKDVPGLPQTIEASRTLGSYVTGYTQKNQDYSLKQIVVDPNNVACDSISSGQKIDQTQIDTQNKTSLTGNNNIVVTIVQTMISKIQGLFQAKVQETAQLQGKGLTPWIHYPLCLFAGCTSDDTTSVSYDTDINKKELTQAGGAVAAMYKTADIDDTYKSKLNAADETQQWDISGVGDTSETVQGTAVNYGQARIVAAGDYMNCTLQPADYQNTAVSDGACSKNWANTTGSCGTTLPNFDKAPDSHCGICNYQDLDTYTKAYGYTIPKLMIDILNAAGSAYHVPASVLLSYLYSEGQLQKNQWTEENVRAWSVCGGKVPNCENLAANQAKGPFQEFDTYFYAQNWDAVQIVDPTRTKEMVSPCNFLDSAFYTAKKLMLESGGSGKYSPAVCWGNAFYSTPAGPATSCNWTPQRISTATRQFTGYCTETTYQGGGGYSGAQTKAENHFDRAIEYYNKFTCH